jgi:hypothetical protein
MAVALPNSITRSVPRAERVRSNVVSFLREFCDPFLSNVRIDLAEERPS